MLTIGTLFLHSPNNAYSVVIIIKADLNQPLFEVVSQ